MRLILIFVLVAGWAFAQIIPGRYVVELSGDAAAAALVREGVRQPGRSAALAVHRARVRDGQAAARRGAVALGATVLGSLDTVANALLVAVPDSRASALAALPGVLRVQPVRRVYPKLNRALEVHRVPEAWNALPEGREGAGAGVKIGIVDSGIDANHPGFAGELPALSGFPKVLDESDLAYTNSKIIVAKNYTALESGGDNDAGDHDGHGTGTAMAAAGGQTDSPYGLISGVAPMAYLGNYKVLSGGSTSSDLIAKAVDDAVADGMDVLNLSLGSIVMSYSDLDPSRWIDVEALSAAAQAGVIVVVAAGNEGPGATTISDYGSLADVITAGAIRNSRYLADGIYAFGSSLAGLPGDSPGPGEPVSAPLFDAMSVDPTGLGCSSLPEGSAAGKVLLILRGTCTFETKLLNAAAAGAVAAIIYNNENGTAFHYRGQYLGTATLPALFVTNSDGMALRDQTAEAEDTTAVLDFRGTTEFPMSTTVAGFSSRGPSLGSALKPDLVAVGYEIVTAAQSTYPSGESYSPTGYLDTAGTSFSAPLAAGAAAVLRAARPGLTAGQYRSLLVNTSREAAAEDDSPAPISQAGAGILNLEGAIGGTIAAYPTALNFGTGQGSIETSLNLSLSNLGTAGESYLVNVIPVTGPAPVPSSNTFSAGSGATSDLRLALSATGLETGEYSGVVEIIPASGGPSVRIPYWYAAPGSTAAGISVLYQKNQVRSGLTTTYAVVFRIVDAAGLPLNGVTPQVSIAAGGGSLRGVYRAGTVPGTYAVDLRGGTGTMQLNITAGDATQTVFIGVD